MKRAVGDNHSVDNVALEVNALKFAQNRTFSECVLAILPALLEVGLQPRVPQPATPRATACNPACQSLPSYICWRLQPTLSARPASMRTRA